MNLSCLEGLTPEESAHLASVAQRQEGPVNETALRDCAATIRREHRLARPPAQRGYWLCGTPCGRNNNR